MGSLFFGCPKSRTAKLDKQEQAIMDCKMTRDKIKSYIRNLERTEKARKEKAKEALKNKNKDRARMYLMQSKLYREQITVASGQLNLIEEQIVQIDTMRFQREAVKVLEQGNKILEDLSKEVNIEKWEKIADDMSELKQQQDEIGNFLKSHSIDQTEYEEAVDKELENLMKLEGEAIDSSLPSVEVKKKISNSEKEYKELEKDVLITN